MADVLVARPGFRDLQVRYVDMLDTTWAEKIVAVNADGSPIGGGGGGATVKATAADPAYVEGTFNPFSADLSGHLRVVSTGGGGGGAVDVTDRAGRLVGVVYGSQGQQIQQTATNYNLKVEEHVGGVAIDPRSIRALTSADQVTALGLGVANAGNSSTATLGIGGVFTGTGVDVRDFAAVVVTFISDQGAAFNGIQLQWSPDNANWDVVDNYNMDFLGVGKSLVSPIRGRFFRVVYTNGGTAQGYFRLNTVLKYAAEVFTVEAYVLGAAGKRGEVQAFGDGVGAQNRLLTDALMRAQRTDTGNQDIVRMTANQNLKTETFVGAAAIDPRSIRALTTADVVAVTDNAGSLTVDAPVATPVAVRLSDGAAFIDPRDVSDRAARLVGVIYGSQAQQLKQTATNFNAQVEIAVGGTLIDPRSIRALTSADVVTAAQGTRGAVGNAWPIKVVGSDDASVAVVESLGGDGTPTTVNSLWTKAALYGFNGATFDRVRATIANGLLADVSDRAAREVGRVRIWDGTDEATVLPVRTQPATTEKTLMVADLPIRLATYQTVTITVAPAITIGVKELLALWYTGGTKDIYIVEIWVSGLVTTASTTGGRTTVRVSTITTAPTGGTEEAKVDVAGGGASAITNTMRVKTGGGAIGSTFIRREVWHATQAIGSTYDKAIFTASSVGNGLIMRGGVGSGFSIDVEREVAHTALVDSWTVGVRWLEL